MSTILAKRWVTGLLFTSLVLASCSSQTIASIAPTVAPTVQVQATQGLATVPTLSPANTNATRELRSYHAVLMLERAADLMLTAIDKIRTGQIQPTDTEAISPYIDAFAVAGDSLNLADPPVEFEDIWQQVYTAATTYNQAYTMLIQGTPISTNDLDYLKGIRQILTTDQQMIERWLAPQGLGNDLFTEQQQAVEKHFQQAYGNKPVPTLP